MLRIRSLALAATLGCLATAVHAGPEQNIRAALEAVSPDIAISDIRPAPVDGLYEVLVGSELMYMTPDGRYFIDGRIVDLETRTDLTEPRLAEARKGLIESIGEESMVSFGPADAAHTVTVFTDIECGYCRKLHSQIDDYVANGIRVRYLFFPRAGEGSEAYREAVSVWCAGDAEARREAMTEAKQGKSIEMRKCDNPVAEHMALGRELGLRGTPAIVTEDGTLIPGYVDPKRLAAELDQMAGS
ncbi:DsbC family protein [Marichromatium gracile]|uniref:Thiol:disulfide interchange protein n=1 Tax=Marichromatium gracile TaxID=1048 RepID=A0ABR5VH51_MARGR|nr:DsbC family protein [Marichromatium gracile]KXX65055.1 disulfide bond formation protein DsbC [Marichromatium gracile]